MPILQIDNLLYLAPLGANSINSPIVPPGPVEIDTSSNDVPPAFTLLKIEGPGIEVPSIKADDLPKNWQAQLEATRDLDTAWLEKNESMLLRVPCVIVPEMVNFLFNPSHKLAAKFRITDVFPYPFDLRLKK